MRLRLLTLLFTGLSLVRCRTTDIPSDLVSSVMGTYTMTSFTISSNPPIPMTGVRTGSVIITRNSARSNTIQFAVSYAINNSGVETKLAQTRTVELRPSGSSLDLYDDKTKIGTLAATVITVSRYSLNGFTVDFTATKQ